MERFSSMEVILITELGLDCLISVVDDIIARKLHKEEYFQGTKDREQRLGDSLVENMTPHQVDFETKKVKFSDIIAL